MKPVRFRVDHQTPRINAVCEQGEFPLPALWLRERCQDPAHVDTRTQQRLFNPHDLPEDLALTEARVDGPQRVWLSFNDGYAGHYDLDLLAEDFDPNDRLPEPRPWDAGLDRDEVTFDWQRLSRDGDLHAALGTLLKRGFLILQRVPTDPERILQVARTFGYPRRTNFGRYFEVYSRPAGNDLAYGSVALGPHTDNPYREPVPGIQILHCLVNEAAGGLSTLADSLAVGRALEAEDPPGFDRLARTPVRFRFRDDDEELIEQRPIIRRNDAGDMIGLHYSPRLDFMPLLEEAELRQFHRARKRLGELLADPCYEIRFPLRAGELLLFDNNRITHGRTAFDASGGRRHLQGCYIDLDEPRSRYRVLSRRLQSHQHYAEAE